MIRDAYWRRRSLKAAVQTVANQSETDRELRLVTSSIMALVMALTVLSCAHGPQSSGASSLPDSESTAVPVPAAEPEPERERSARIEFIFNALNRDTMNLLESFYDPEIVFQDPIVHIEGLPDLRAYYVSMYESVEEIRFDIANHYIDGDRHVVSWTMTVVHERFNQGKEVVVDGVSVIHFNASDLVVYHRDYFDMGALVYEHVPLLGYVVGRVKERIRNK